MEGTPFFGPDFSPLAETPPTPPEKRPEVIKDDDDDDIEEEKPKTLLDYLKKDPKEDKKKEPEKVEEETEPKESEEDKEADETEADLEDSPDEDLESDTNAQEMTAEEEQMAATEIITSREEEVRNELADAKTAEAENEALAAGVFLDTANQELQNGQPVDAAIETGEERAKETLGIEDAEENDNTDDETEQPETESVIEPEINEPPEMVEPDEPEAEDDATSSTTGATPPVPPTPPTGFPPMPPHGPGGFGGPGGPGTPGGPTVTGGNVLPAAPNTTPVEPPEAVYGRRVNTGGAVLAGGLVGYLLGRRRGRIKTERKLLPVQHKLEKEIADLHRKIAWKEAGIRHLAREQTTKNPEIVEKTAERLKAAKEAKEATEANKANEAVSKSINEDARRQESKTAESERLGRFAVDAERPSQSEAFRSPEQLKPIDLMTVPELLTVAEKIEIEQSTVRKLYEANRINYEGLRRIVRAFLRGERYDQIVKDNLLTPEKYAYQETLQRNSTQGSQVMGGGMSLPDSPAQTTPMQAQTPANYNSDSNSWQTPVQPETKAKTQISNSSIIIVGVIIAIIILIFIVIR